MSASVTSNTGAFDRIPTEVTSIIFVFFTHDEKTTDFGERESDTTSFHARRGPIILGSVCRNWREITLTTTQLWTTLPVQLENIESKKKPYFDMTKTFLSRSGKLLLSFEFHGEHDKSRTKGLKPLATIVNSFYHRWKSIKLYSAPTFLFYLTGCDQRKTLPPVLETLVIVQEAYLDIPESKFVTKPIPSPVVVNSVLPYKLLGISWDLVTRLKLKALSSFDFIDVLKLAPRLQTFSVTEINDIRDMVTEIHEAISHFEITHLDACPPPVVFQMLILPSCVSLAIDDRYDEQLLEGLFATSYGQLKTLKVLSKEGHKRDLNRVLRHLPLLEELVIDLAEFDQEALFGLLASSTKLDGTDEAFLPALRSIRYNKFGATFPWEVVPSLFPPEERKPGASYRPFVSLVVEIAFHTERAFGKIPNYISEKDLEGLDKVVGRGLCFKVVDMQTRNDFIEGSKAFHAHGVNFLASTGN